MNKIELSNYLGRSKSSVLRTLASLRASGLPIPAAGAPITDEFAAELKMRLERDGKTMREKWLAEMATSGIDEIAESFCDDYEKYLDKNTGFFNLTTKGLTDVKNQFLADKIVEIMKDKHNLDVSVFVNSNNTFVSSRFLK